MKQRSYPQMDKLKYAITFLVIAIHCAPFLEISEVMNLIFVQGIARIAVPLYFIISGFFFFKKIDQSKGWKDTENLGYLKTYCFRILKLYAIWSILYLPLYFYPILKDGNFSILSFLMDVLYHGTYYHLWFLPALIVGMILAYTLSFSFSNVITIGIACLLYVIGSMLNTYSPLYYEIPLLQPLLHVLSFIFQTGRNGFFFAPIFLLIGRYFSMQNNQSTIKSMNIKCMIWLFAYVLEVYFLYHIQWLHSLSSMYLTLVPLLFYGFSKCLQLKMEETNTCFYLRKMSFLIYVGHIYIVFLCFRILNLPNIITYVVTCGISSGIAYWIVKKSQTYHFFKQLYE